MSKEKNKKRKKKNGGKIIVLLIIIIIAAAVILLLGRGGFGFGGGSGEGVPAGGTLPNMPETSAAKESEETEEDTAAVSEEAAEDEGQGSRVIIEIAEDKIFADGSVCADGAILRDHLLGAAGDDTEFILRDNHGVKSVYDEAKGVLDELGYEYSLETVE